MIGSLVWASVGTQGRGELICYLFRPDLEEDPKEKERRQLA